MREPCPGSSDFSAIETTAWRYAAGDLPALEAAAFEARLAGDQSAREALAEAVRLSAAALGQGSPAPNRGFRALIRDRVRGSNWLARRVYRGHPLAWAGIGATVVAAASLFAVHLAGNETLPHVPPETRTVAAAPTNPTPVAGSSAPSPQLHPEEAKAAEHAAAETHEDAARTAAEIWAELSTPDHVEKTHDDEAKLHHRLKHLNSGHMNHSFTPLRD